ncbi:HAMP domain-containing sensor histidine kinase [Streptomyces sp. NPDC005962]|uniref:sensor histidine kinase n=1 Tax=Streptomyces sp. NPDC005962 TaxID=3154466 RepID=UPI00340C67BC
MTRRLLLSYLSLTVLVLLGLEIPLGVLFQRNEVSHLYHSAQRDAFMVAELIEEDVPSGRTPTLAAFVTEYAQCMGGRVVVFSLDGEVLTDSDNPTAGPAAAAAHGATVHRAVTAALRNERSVGMFRGPAKGRALVSVAEPVTVGPEVRGAVWTTSPATSVDTRIHKAWWTLSVIGVAVLAMVVLIAFALARWITRPVRALEGATAQLGYDGALSAPLAADLGPPELRRLAGSFNRTATRLQHVLRAQRSFAAEASHQLQTPLTALRLQLETLRMGLGARAHAAVDAAVEEIDRLTRMVQGLLALAHLEDSATTPGPVHLDGVLRDRAEMWAGFAAEHGVTVAVTGPPVGWARAIPDALEQIIDNLLANALSFAPFHSTITLATAPGARTRGDGGGEPMVEFHVIDQGPGMTEEQRRRAFDRFWRAPDSSHEGSGLGLAIVQQLVHAGGGEITLDRAPGGGLHVVVRLVAAGGTAVGTDFGTKQHKPPAGPRR